jgi:hypothetical protein
MNSPDQSVFFAADKAAKNDSTKKKWAIAHLLLFHPDQTDLRNKP